MRNSSSQPLLPVTPVSVPLGWLRSLLSQHSWGVNFLLQRILILNPPALFCAPSLKTSPSPSPSPPWHTPGLQEHSGSPPLPAPHLGRTHRHSHSPDLPPTPDRIRILLLWLPSQHTVSLNMSIRLALQSPSPPPTSLIKPPAGRRAPAICLRPTSASQNL